MALSIEPDPVRGWSTARAASHTTVEDVVTTINTARASVATRMEPMIFDGREASGSTSPDEIGPVVDALEAAMNIGGRRGHAALVVSDRAVYKPLLDLGSRCAVIGIPLVRVLFGLPDAERWLRIVSGRDLR